MSFLRLAGHRFPVLLQVSAEPELGHRIHEQAEDHDHRQCLDPGGVPESTRVLRFDNSTKGSG
jgi:hypothetical protein